MNDAHDEPPDAELIDRIRRKADESSAAQSALAQLYDRHVQFLLRCAQVATRDLVGYGFDAEDIVIETFETVWMRGAESFSLPPGASADAARRRVRSWLLTIAKHLLLDKIRSSPRAIPVDPCGANEAVFSPGGRSFSARDLNDVTRVVASCLSQRDAAVVWFKARYYNPETRKSHPPPAELAAFCAEWGITPESVRKVYERALVTVREAIEQPAAIPNR